MSNGPKVTEEQIFAMHAMVRDKVGLKVIAHRMGLSVGTVTKYTVDIRPKRAARIPLADQTEFKFRVPTEVHTKCVKQAAAMGLTLTAWTRLLLERETNSSLK